MSHYKDLGLLSKYDLVRADGQPEDATIKQFTLRYDKDSAWCAAMRDIIRTTVVPRVRALGYEKLASELTYDVEAVESEIEANRTATPQALPEL